MINTNELMLGNLVEYKGEYGLITAIRTHHVNVLVDKYEHTKVPFEDINPIELTDDVVSKLGGTENHKTWRVLHHWQNAGTINYPEGGALDITPLLQPKPILKTYDGVEITSEDATIWMCYRSGINCNGKKDNPSRVLVKTQLTNQFKDKLHYFSTREASVNYINTKWAELHPEPIFVTEDGVGIFDKNAEVWVCYKRGMNEFDSKDNPACDTVARQIVNPFRDELLLFSSKSSCQAYIDQKWAETHPEPLLVTRDGVEVYDKDAWVYVVYEDATHSLRSDVKDVPSPKYVSGYLNQKYAKPILVFSTRELAQSYIDQKWAEAHPEPIFVTEDGVSIYEGDTCYYCNKSGFWGSLKANSDSGKDADHSYFSTEQLARAYLNKMLAEIEYNNLLQYNSIYADRQKLAKANLNKVWADAEYSNQINTKPN